MRTRRRATTQDLRLAIHSLPRMTRIAMLQGMEANEIIVGAYTSRDGICPMLAAHRHGGRTNLISFAKAWDRFAFSGSKVTNPRPATARELLVLRTHLEASLLEEDTPQADLAAAIDSHRELISRQTERPEEGIRVSDRRVRGSRREDRPRPRPGDADRTVELKSTPGWRWMRLVRRYDEYQWALEQVHAQQQAEAHQRAEPPQRAEAQQRAPQHTQVLS